MFAVLKYRVKIYVMCISRFLGNPAVTFYELNSIYGHDTFLLDLNGVGSAVKVSTANRVVTLSILFNRFMSSGLILKLSGLILKSSGLIIL